MHSTHNERKSVVDAEFIRTLKNKNLQIQDLYQKMYILINQMTQLISPIIYHSTIKTKSVYIKSSTYIDSSKEIDNKDPEFKIGDIIRIPKYKNIFAKGYVPNWSVEVFVIKNVKNTVPRTCYQ